MMSHESNVKKALLYYLKFCQVSFLLARLVPSLSLCFWIEKKDTLLGSLSENYQDPTLTTLEHPPFPPIGHGYSRCPFPYNSFHSTEITAALNLSPDCEQCTWHSLLPAPPAQSQGLERYTEPERGRSYLGK